MEGSMALVHLQDESVPSAITIRGKMTIAPHQNLGPGTFLHQIYLDVGERLAKKADQIAQHLGLGPEVVTQRIREAFGEKDQVLLKLVELYRSRKYKTVVPWTLPITKYCSELIHYTFHSEASETRLQAFNCIITLVAFYPGLRQLLLLNKDLRRTGGSQEAMLTLWECDGPCTKEWEYKRRLTAAILSEDEIGTLIETTRPKELGYVDSDGSGSVIEKLLSIIDCDGIMTHSGVIAVRYLGGILRLPTFWRRSKYRSHSSVATKLFRGVERILKDIGIDAAPMDNIDCKTTDVILDVMGIDYLGEAILSGILIWAKNINIKGFESFSWWEGLQAVIVHLRKSMVEDLLPLSWHQASSDHFKRLLPSAQSTSLNEEYDSLTENEAGSNDVASGIGILDEEKDISAPTSPGKLEKPPIKPRDSVAAPKKISKPKSNKRVKLVVVGDGLCGKSCLLHLYAKGTFSEIPLNGLFDQYLADVEVDGQTTELSVWDTPGQEDYDRLRPIVYPDSQVVLICFKIDTPDSLDNVMEKWILEINHFCQNLPIILVGCKKDLRRDPYVIEELRRTSQRPTTPDEGVLVALRIGAQQYLECSAKTGEGIKEVFQQATRAALQGNKRPSRRSRLFDFFRAQAVPESSSSSSSSKPLVGVYTPPIPNSKQVDKQGTNTTERSTGKSRHGKRIKPSQRNRHTLSGPRVHTSGTYNANRDKTLLNHLPFPNANSHQLRNPITDQFLNNYPDESRDSLLYTSKNSTIRLSREDEDTDDRSVASVENTLDKLVQLSLSGSSTSSNTVWYP